MAKQTSSTCEVYTVHPSTIAATPHGSKFVSSRADAYTSKLGDVLRARYARLAGTNDHALIKRHRALVLAHQHLQFDSQLTQTFMRALGMHASKMSVP